jgi:hypothetical protein
VRSAEGEDEVEQEIEQDFVELLKTWCSWRTV